MLVMASVSRAAPLPPALQTCAVVQADKSARAPTIHSVLRHSSQLLYLWFATRPVADFASRPFWRRLSVRLPHRQGLRPADRGVSPACLPASATSSLKH